jgi:hypothetical protein
MSAYDIFTLCTDCGCEHPMLMRIYIDDGPSRKQSIAESFQGRSLHRWRLLGVTRLYALKQAETLLLKMMTKFFSYLVFSRPTK